MEKYNCTVGLLCYVFEFSCLSFAKLITHTYICFVKMKPAKQDINREYSLTRANGCEDSCVLMLSIEH